MPRVARQEKRFQEPFLVFKDKAAHDEYQKAARHLKFIEENQSNWKKVRVFDSTVEP